MLFNISKQKSLAVLQLAAAIFILIAPSAFGFMNMGVSVYLLFACFSALIAMRIKTGERVLLSVYSLIFLILALYSVISLIWVNNRGGQVIYIFALCTLAVFFSLSSEYFAENSEEGIRRRLMYMVSFSGIICAIVNILYWTAVIVPVAGKNIFSHGIGNAHFLSIFMVLCTFMVLSLIKGNSASRKVLLIAGAGVTVFTFIMTKSVIGWGFAILFTAADFAKKKFKSEKGFTTFSIAIVMLFTALIVFWLALSTEGKAFSDVMGKGMKNLFGTGGGFWSGRELFSQMNYGDKVRVGLLGYVFASSGIPGLLCCLCLCARNVMTFLKLKTRASLTGLIICPALMLIPLGENIVTLILWLGLTAYNEHCAGVLLKYEVRKEKLEKSLYILAVFIIISIVLFVLAVIRTNGDRAYKNKEYEKAYSLYKTAATINPFDSVSCRMAASSLRKSGDLHAEKDMAIRIIDKAIKRDSDSLENIREKALIYEMCGELELSAQQYRIASQKAMVKDKYNLSLAKVLYKIVKKYPKGSSETKRAYEEITVIAQSTENLQKKKVINDIADKALTYTKEELENSEN